ncbi:MAG TPA: N-methyl-L-tryptophan oxidase, partial [Thermomicrobiales bacterium]|nr:N-methyl-L-tryptophan oxidase [Thermomicrobiales bacterium]
MSSAYDAIVLGLGAMGSATAYHLARRGTRVLGLDAYPRGHTQGSSHGRSRIIREAYFEAPEYVPLVQRAYHLWRELEAECGQALLTLTGGLNLGAPESELVTGALASARQHQLPYEYLNAAEITARFPGFRPPEDAVAVYEPNAGILAPEACVGAHLDLAMRHGAVLQFNEPVRHWSADGAGVRVDTAQGTYQAARLVIAAGPWSAAVLA